MTTNRIYRSGQSGGVVGGKWDENKSREK